MVSSPLAQCSLDVTVLGDSFAGTFTPRRGVFGSTVGRGFRPVGSIFSRREMVCMLSFNVQFGFQVWNHLRRLL